MCRRKNIAVFVGEISVWLNPFVTEEESATSDQTASLSGESVHCNLKPVEGAGQEILRRSPFQPIANLRIATAPATRTGNEHTFGCPTVNRVLYSGPPKQRFEGRLL